MEYHTASPWGYLITEDKKARPLLKSLYRAIVSYIIQKIEPRTVRHLTPEKLAAFYREVGGNLDSFFLESDPLTISEVFTTLGCVHSLLPNPEDDFSPPRIPALQPRGFERWQTIQLLMDPDEHAPYLQEAVKKFKLLDPNTEEGFADLGPIPRDAFPMAPDEETVEWHKNVFLKRIEDIEEREKAAAEEKLKNANGPIPGGGTPTDEDGIRLEEEIELEMKPAGLRTPYSTTSRSHSRNSSGDHSYGYDSSYDDRGRSRSPLKPKGIDPELLYAQRGQQRHYGTPQARYATPDPSSDLDDHRHTRSRSRKNSHVQYVFQDGTHRPMMDNVSVRSVSPSVHENYAQSAASHHPVRKGRNSRIGSSDRASTRGRSADPYYSNYAYAEGYMPRSRTRYYSPSPAPLPKFRSKSHEGGRPFSPSSDDDDYHQYRSYASAAQMNSLPPMATNYVHYQEVSPAGLRRSTRTSHTSIPADYYENHTPPSHPHSYPNHQYSAGGSSSSSTAHPHSATAARAPHPHILPPGPVHSPRPHSPQAGDGGRGGARGHGRHNSGHRGYHSGTSSRYQSSTESLAPPKNNINLPPIPPLSGTTVPTTASGLPPPSTNAIPVPSSAKLPKKSSYASVVTDSEDEFAEGYYAKRRTHLSPHHSPSGPLRGAASGGATASGSGRDSGSGGSSNARRAARREREREIEQDRQLKMSQMQAQMQYDDEVLLAQGPPPPSAASMTPGGGRFGRAAAGGSGSGSGSTGWPPLSGGGREGRSTAAEGARTYGLGIRTGNR